MKGKVKSTKKYNKGKKDFKKGDQCVQNPKRNVFRSEAKSKFHINRKGLTVDALEKHNELIEEDAISCFGALTVSDATSAKSKAFSISGLTDCSNITFHKVVDKWNSPSQTDREKCAVLAAVTEVIRANGGKETETEYFAALMTVLCRESNDKDSISAIAYLLSLVIKKVPPSLLKLKFSEASKCFVGLLEKYGQEGKAPMLICLLECLSLSLQVQEPAVWAEASTQHCFLILLSFIVHSKPKVRKSAHIAVKSVLKVTLSNQRNHPAGVGAANFVSKLLNQHSTEDITSTHHILNFLKNTLYLFNKENIKKVCEGMLRLILINDVLLRVNVLQTLNSLFTSQPSEENLPKDLNLKLISALYDFQPSVNDVNIVSGWLTTMCSAHQNLALRTTGSIECISYLHKFYTSVLTYLTSNYKDIVSVAINTIKSTTEACMLPEIEVIVEDVNLKKENSEYSKIFNLLESGMKYKYQPVWNQVLQLLGFYFQNFGKQLSSIMMNCIVSLVDLHDIPQFPYIEELKKAVGDAVQAIGPRKFLEASPMNLIRNDDVCDFPRSWLLPLMKDNISNTELSYFISTLLPIAAQLKAKAAACLSENNSLKAKVYTTLHNQIWGLLPGFCTNPVDLAEFSKIAKILGTALMERDDLRGLVLQALRTLISKSDDDESIISQYSKNYIPILFNLYTSDKEECKSISLSIFETIKSFLVITDKKLISSYLSKMFSKLDEETVEDKKHKLADLMIAMTKYADEAESEKLYQIAIENLFVSDKSTQKKAYRVLEEMLDCKSNTVDLHIEELKMKFLESLSHAAPSSKASRLRCLSTLVQRTSAEDKKFIISVIPEVILCTKEVGVKAKAAAFDLLVDIGRTLVFISPLPKEEVVEEYISLVMAGLAGSPHMQSATLLAFTKLMFEYRYCITSETVKSLLDSTINLLKSRNREVIKSAIIFIRASAKILNADEITGHLETLVPNLFAWNYESKNAYRQQLRVILERLHKKVGFEILKNFIPDEHRKFLVAIHKNIENAKKNKDAKERTQASELEETNRGDENSAKDETWEDILSDSDDEEKDNKKKSNKKVNGKQGSKDSKSWIVETDDATNLLDSSMAKNVVGTKPKQKNKLKRKEHFELSSEGKIIINDDDEKIAEDTPLDIGEKNVLGGYVKAPRNVKLGKRKLAEDMPEEEKFAYKPGGAGIHRDRDNDDESGKAHRSGQEYKAKRARGDIKLKGKPDPYAYVQFNKQKLNKRKKSKLENDFTGLIKGGKSKIKNRSKKQK